MVDRRRSGGNDRQGIVSRDDFAMSGQYRRQGNKASKVGQMAEVLGYNSPVIKTLLEEKMARYSGIESFEPRTFYSLQVLEADAAGVFPLSTALSFFQASEDTANVRWATNMPDRGKFPVGTTFVANRLGFETIVSFAGTVTPDMKAAFEEDVLTMIAMWKAILTFGGRSSLKIGKMSNFPEGSRVYAPVSSGVDNPAAAAVYLAKSGNYNLGDCLYKPENFSIPFVMHGQETFVLQLDDQDNVATGDANFADTAVFVFANLHGVLVQTIA